MNAPEKLEVPVVVNDTDGNEHEVERLTYKLERNGKSRWAKLFGTPERAARTLIDSCNDDYDYGCGGCPVARVNCKCGDYYALLEWLRGEGE